MKRNVYYQYPGETRLTAFECRRRPKDKARKLKLSREEAYPYDEGFIYHRPLDEMRPKELRKADVRRDLMRLGIIW